MTSIKVIIKKVLDGSKRFYMILEGSRRPRKVLGLNQSGKYYRWF
jgi:hypothetical protein